MKSTDMCSDRQKVLAHALADAAASKREARKKRAWKLQAGAWYRRLQLTQDISIALHHDEPSSSYADDHVHVFTKQSCVGCELDIPAAQLRKLAHVLIEASLHVQRLEKRAQKLRTEQRGQELFK